MPRRRQHRRHQPAPARQHGGPADDGDLPPLGPRRPGAEGEPAGRLPDRRDLQYAAHRPRDPPLFADDREGLLHSDAGTARQTAGRRLVALLQDPDRPELPRAGDLGVCDLIRWRHGAAQLEARRLRARRRRRHLHHRAHRHRRAGDRALTVPRRLRRRAQLRARQARHRIQGPRRAGKQPGHLLSLTGLSAVAPARARHAAVDARARLPRCFHRGGRRAVLDLQPLLRARRRSQGPARTGLAGGGQEDPARSALLAAVDRLPGGGRAVPGRQRLHLRRCGAPLQSHRRVRHEHRDRRCGRPRLEARGGLAGLGRPGAARQLRGRAPAHRRAQHHRGRR